MIIIILAVFAVLAFWANMTIKSTVTRYVTVTVMFIGLTLSVVAIVANMHSHFGMKKVVTTTQQVHRNNNLGYFCIKVLGLRVKKMFIFTRLHRTPRKRHWQNRI